MQEAGFQPAGPERPSPGHRMGRRWLSLYAASSPGKIPGLLGETEQRHRCPRMEPTRARAEAAACRGNQRVPRRSECEAGIEEVAVCRADSTKGDEREGRGLLCGPLNCPVSLRAGLAGALRMLLA